MSWFTLQTIFGGSVSEDLIFVNLKNVPCYDIVKSVCLTIKEKNLLLTKENVYVYSWI